MADDSIAKGIGKGARHVLGDLWNGLSGADEAPAQPAAQPAAAASDPVGSLINTFTSSSDKPAVGDDTPWYESSWMKWVGSLAAAWMSSSVLGMFGVGKIKGAIIGGVLAMGLSWMLSSNFNTAANQRQLTAQTAPQPTNLILGAQNDTIVPPDAPEASPS